MKQLKLFTAAALLVLSVGLSAQPQPGTRPEPPKMKSPEEIAKKEADIMKLEVGLTDKQYKKVYKLIKQDQQYRQSQAEKQFGGGMPPQGGMGGPGGGFGGGPMGGPGSGFGGGSMGGPGGSFNGGTPPQGGMQSGQRPEGFPKMGGPGADLVSEDYLEKQDQKLKKILTGEQYSKWRAKHPAEHLELPPLEMK